MSSEPLTEEDGRGRSECGLTGEGGAWPLPASLPQGAAQL